MVKVIRACFDLIKYKLSLAVVLSAVTGYFLSGVSPDAHLLFVAAGIFLLSSGSAAMNQYTERVPDSIMERTMYRPVPSNIIPERTAFLTSVILLLAGSIFLLINGIAPFLLGILTVLLYNVIYTRLKKVTVFSIIPGAFVGALPPLTGYYSAGVIFLNFDIIAFSVFMFLWQIPHFWLIIIKYGKEYKDAGFKTIAKYFSEQQIRILVFIWVLLSTCSIFLFCIFSDSSFKNLLYPVAILNIAFIYLFHRLLFSGKKAGEIRGAFILINSFSVFIMFLIIAASLLKSL